MSDFVKRLNWVGLLSMLALVVLGTIAIASAGGARAETVFHGMWKQHLATAAVGFAVYLVLAAANYRSYLPFAAVPAYVVALALLVIVLFVGSTIYGGRRWLWFFQPSEIAKLCTLAMLAVLCARSPKTAFQLILACVLVAAPVLLILLEPDLGTALALVPAALAVMISGRVGRRLLIFLLSLVALSATAVLAAVHEADRPGTSAARREAILRWVPLRPHQLQRVRVFLNPEEDVAGAGYNLRQSKISIGTGGVTGKGIGKGENNHLKYLPQSISMNDFIFCVWAEETGFVGSLALLALFGALLFSCCRTAFVATDATGQLLVLGVATLLFAHVFINIAMSVGLVPITGLPLPFVSSGRTFLLTVMAGLGLVQSVAIHGTERKGTIGS